MAGFLIALMLVVAVVLIALAIWRAPAVKAGARQARSTADRQMATEAAARTTTFTQVMSRAGDLPS